MVKYIRDGSYMAFRKAVSAGMGYEDYLTISGETILPVGIKQVRGFMKYILPQDVRWMNLVTVDVLVLCLLQGEYSRELDEYLTTNSGFTINRVYTSEVEVREGIGTLHGIYNLINKLREFKNQGDIYKVLTYKFLMHHMGHIRIVSEQDMFMLDEIVKGLDRLLLGSLTDGEYTEEVEQYKKIMGELNNEILRIQAKIDRGKELAKYIKYKKLECNYCPTTTGDEITYIEQGVQYINRIKYMGSKKVLHTVISQGTKRVEMDSEFCRHCGRHVDEGMY